MESDPKYKEYVHSIEYQLAFFDRVSEWADVSQFINALIPLLKKYSRFHTLPHKLKLTKRLAQCLHRALPTGVHKGTLEAYEVILESIGPEQMQRDLALYSHGLFPFLEHAATDVKKQLLVLYNKYYVSLGMGILPCLKGFQLALMPALEEEGNVYFDLTISLLDTVYKNVGHQYFHEALALGMISCRKWRQSSLNYLAKRPIRLADMDVEGSRLLTEAFTACVADKDVYVQRSALDLLNAIFPLSPKGEADTKSMPDAYDLQELMSAALKTLLRRDMSLNKRLFSWLLGPNPEEAARLAYFAQRGRSLVIGSLIGMATGKDMPNPIACRVALALLDRWEVGSTIIPDILPVLLQAVNAHPSSEELRHSATAYIRGVEPALAWKVIISLIHSGKQSDLDCVTIALAMSNTSDPDGALHVRNALFFACSSTQALVAGSDHSRIPQYVEIIRLLSEFPSLTEYEDKVAPPVDISPVDILIMYGLQEGDPVPVLVPAATDFRLIHSLLVALLEGREAGMEPVCETISAIRGALAPQLLRTSGDGEGGVLTLMATLAHGDVRWVMAVLPSLIEEPRELEMVRDSLHLPAVLYILWQSLSALAPPQVASAVALLAAVVERTHTADVFATIVTSDLCRRPPSPGPGTSISTVLTRYSAVWMRVPDPGAMFGLSMLSLTGLLKDGDEEGLIGRFVREDDSFLPTLLTYILPLLGEGDDACSQILGSDPPDPHRSASALRLFHLLSLHLPHELIVCARGADVGSVSYLRHLIEYITTGLTDPILRPPSLPLLKALIPALSLRERSLIPPIQRTLLEALASPAETEPARLIDLLLLTLDTATPSNQTASGSGDHTVDPSYLSGEEGEEGIRALRNRLLAAIRERDVGLTHGHTMSVWGAALDRLLPHLRTDLAFSQCLIPLICSLSTRIGHAPFNAGEEGGGDVALFHRFASLELRVSWLGKIILHFIDIEDLSMDGSRVRSVPFATAGSHLPDLEPSSPSSSGRPSSDGELPPRSIQEASAPPTSTGSAGSTSTLPAPSTGGLLSLFGSSSTGNLEGRKGGSGGRGARITAQAYLFSQLPAIISSLLHSLHLLILRHPESAEGLRAQRAISRLLSRLLARHRKECLGALISVWMRDELPGDGEGPIIRIMEGLEYRECLLASMDLSTTSTYAGGGGVNAIVRTSRICLLGRLIRSSPLEDLHAVMPSIDDFCRYMASGSAGAEVKGLLLRLVGEAWGRVEMLVVESEWRSLRESISEVYLALQDSLVSDWASVISDERAMAKVKSPPEDISSLTEGTSVGGEASFPSSSAPWWGSTPEGPSQAGGVVPSMCYLANHSIPSLPSLSIPEAMVTRFLGRLISLIALPAVKVEPGKRPLPLYLIGLHLFRQIALIAPSLPPACPWKREVWELYGEAGFFRVPLDLLGDTAPWRPVLRAALQNERERVNESLARLTASSTNIFTSKETEALVRAQSIHRFSYLILCGERDQFLPQLPQLQEKVVELLKTQSNSFPVLTEVYLCLRIILFKHSSKHLTSFWPLIITEMVSFFTDITEKKASLSKKDEEVLLAICKFLDLIITLAPTEFQLFQWIFVRELGMRKGEKGPEGEEVDNSVTFTPTLESLGRRLSGAHWDAQLHMMDYQPDPESLRRPALEPGTTVSQLEAFFATLGSTLSFRSAAAIDEVYIDRMLEMEFFH